MQVYWHVVVAVTAILVKENFGVPAIRQGSHPGIIFPEDNWDDCFMDKASTQPGVCKSVEECPEILKKWDRDNVYPKTCYFIKKEQFVCCPIATAKDATTTPKKPNANSGATTTKKPVNIFHDIFNTDPGSFTKKPNNAIGATPSKRPSNIFLDNLTTNRGPTTQKRPSNIFLDNLTTAKTTHKKPPIIIPDIFNTERPVNVNRRSAIECDLQNQDKFENNADGGQPKTNEFPFMVAVGFRTNGENKIWYPCGGVLVSSRYVLTAAHCAEIGGVNPSFVHVGGTTLTESEEGIIPIKQFIAHPDYDVNSINNDIALVELDQEVNNPTACLWSTQDVPITKLTALGYGHTRFGGIGSNELLVSPLSVIDNAECQQFYKVNDTLQTIDIMDAQLCAGDTEHFRHTCQGDSGGPLIMELDKVSYVMGITSYGLGCADLPPSIYTRVSSFINWIEPIIWPEIDVRFDRK